MTKHLHRIRAALSKQLLERGVPLQRPLPAAARDGYTALWLWSQHDEPVHRLTPEQAIAARTGLPLDLKLAYAPTRGPALAYQLLEREEWIVVARIASRDVVEVGDGRYAYAEPMLCYITEVSGSWATGCLNFGHSPTPRELQLSPGNYYRELYQQPLSRDDIRTEVTRLAMVLPHYYCQFVRP